MWTVIGLLVTHVLLTVTANSCPTGFYGPRCRRLCKEQSHCLENDCVLLRSGRALNCSQGCKSGWRGLSCNTNCKHPCKECERYTGKCVGACRDGYYGEDCSRECPIECEKCDINSGECDNRMFVDESNREGFVSGQAPGPRVGEVLAVRDGVGQTVYSSKSESPTDSSAIRSSPNTSPSISSSPKSRSSPSMNNSMDGESLVITVITGVLVVICVVVVTTTYFLLFYKRRGSKTGLKDRVWERHLSSGSGSPFLDQEYLHPETGHAYPKEEHQSPFTGHMYPCGEGTCWGTRYPDTEVTSKASEHLYDEIDNYTPGSVDRSYYITPVHTNPA